MEIARRLERGKDLYIGQAPMKRLEERLLDPRLAGEERLITLYRLGGYVLQLGRYEESISYYDQAIASLRESTGAAAPGSRAREALVAALLGRATAFMRLAEARNCVMGHTTESCIFPLRGGGIHSDTGPAKDAMSSLLMALELKPKDAVGRWLLNLTAMMQGRHPEAVPEKFRIDPAQHQASTGIARFVDMAPMLGLNAFNLAGGVVVDDLDGDGWLDIVTSTSDPFGEMTFHRNRADGRFEDQSSRSGLDQQLGGLNLVAGDYDNDSDLDILVLRGAWHYAEGMIRNSLLRNDGEGRFTDVTRAVGLGGRPMPTQTATWGDFDNDGALDLFVGNETSSTRNLYFPCQLFRNQGDGTFVDIAPSAGVTNDRYAKGVAAGDFDDDGDLDIYVSNIGANRLYRNNGDSTFTDIAPTLGLTGPQGRSFASWFFDFDNDGDLDLFVGAYEANITHVAGDYVGLAHETASPALYRNNGDGSFTDIAIQAGLDRPWMPMGANFGDLDSDGFLDIYLGTGDPNFMTLVPNVMLRNAGGRKFEDVTISGGFGHLQKGHGIGFADLDHDGDEDVFHQLGGFYPDDRFGNALFVNPGGGGHFLQVQLRGKESNRFGIGARVRVRVETAAGSKELHRAVGSVSSFGGSPVGRLTIGLGSARRIEELEVWWPRSGTRSIYSDVPFDGLVQITEGAQEMVRLPFRAVVLGGKSEAP